jgi:hypothetical protein
MPRSRGRQTAARLAREGNDERADGPDEADTAVVTIGRAESARHVADRPPGGGGGEDKQPVETQEAHGSTKVGRACRRDRSALAD